MIEAGRISYQGDLWQGDKVTPAIAKATEEARRFAIFALKAKTPVRTGNLQQRWSVNKEGRGLRITNSAKYAIYVEMGTSRMKPRHMLTNTIPEIETTFKKALAKELGKSLGAKVISAITGSSYGNTQAERLTRSMSKPTYERLTGRK